MRLKTIYQRLDIPIPTHMQENQGLELFEQEISGLAVDSRAVQPGNVFIAIRGFTTDGHLYIEKAMAQGAIAIVCEDREQANRLQSTAPAVLFLVVADSRRALAVLARSYYKDPSGEFQLIGITGTNGKTSIAHMLTQMLRTRGELTGLIGTLGNQIGDRFFPTQNTTPEALELQRLFSQMSEAGVTTCVMEVSSHALALNRVLGVSFDVAVFTNLTEDHLDFHPDMEAYYQAKAGLFKMALTGNVINCDDPYGERLHRELTHQGYSCLTYGLAPDADVRADHIQFTAHGTDFELHVAEGRLQVHIPMPGRFYVYNALAAIGALMMCDWTLEDLAVALKGLRPVPGRMENIPTTIQATVLVDYAHTPDALEQALTTAREFTTGRLSVVFGCGGNRDTTKRPLMGAIADRLADAVYLTSDNPRHEPPMQIIQDVLAGMQPAIHTPEVFEDRQRAITVAVDRLESGDTLLIAGKGHEAYQLIGDRVLPFDDRTVATDALKERGIWNG